MVPYKSVWAGIGVVGMLVGIWNRAYPGANDAAVRRQALYTEYCAVCHGDQGQGRVQGNATSLNNPDFLALASDTFLHTTIAQGRRDTAMRGWLQAAGAPLNREEIRDRLPT